MAVRFVDFLRAGLAVVLLVDLTVVLAVGFTVVLLVGFTVVLLAGVAVRLLVGFAVTLPVVFAGVLLAVVLAGVLLVVLETGFAAAGDALPAVAFVSAEASINGFVFLDGSVARTCLIALACSSSVILNSWWPSRLATK